MILSMLVSVQPRQTRRLVRASMKIEHDHARVVRVGLRVVVGLLLPRIVAGSPIRTFRIDPLADAPAGLNQQFLSRPRCFSTSIRIRSWKNGLLSSRASPADRSPAATQLYVR